MFEIRTATEADLEQIAVLFDQYRQFYQQPPDLAAARSFISERLRLGDSKIFQALSEGRAVGFTQLYPAFSSVSGWKKDEKFWSYAFTLG
jgi:hypothetical protein